MNKCPECNTEYIFFDAPDEKYEVGDIDKCPGCGLEVIIDWDGEEGTNEVERILSWYK